MKLECISLKQIQHNSNWSLYHTPSVKKAIETAVANGETDGKVINDFDDNKVTNSPDVIHWFVTEKQPTYKGIKLGERAIHLDYMELGTVTAIHENETSCTLLLDSQIGQMHGNLPMGGFCIQRKSAICSYEKFKHQHDLIMEFKKDMETKDMDK